MLTQQQVTQWETFGFLHLRGVLNADELEVINAEYEKGLNRTRDQMDSLVGNRRQLNWPNMGADTPFLAGLLEDPRICGVAEQLFGDDVVGVARDVRVLLNAAVVVVLAATVAGDDGVEVIEVDVVVTRADAEGEDLQIVDAAVVEILDIDAALHRVEAIVAGSAA